MPLDPQALEVIRKYQAFDGLPMHLLPIPQARERAARWAATVKREAVDVARKEDFRVAVAGGEIRVRVYHPTGKGALPIFVFFHGGGWVLGGLDNHDGICGSLAKAAECVVASVEYRLAPEHKFPVPVEDAYAATKWAAERAADFGGDGSRIAVGGDSAGATLATVVTLMARDRGGPRLVHQLLIYPALDPSCDTPSCRENGTGYILSRDMMVWCWNHYLRNDADRTNPYAAPIHAKDLRGLPPAHVISAEFDPLRDEDEAYAARLREAGVPVLCARYDGMVHGFFFMPGSLDRAKDAHADAVRALREAFARG